MRSSVVFVLLMSCAWAGAQVAAPPPTADGMVRMRIQGIDIPAIANAPFTAKVVVEWDRPLIGGGTVSRMYYTMVARDAQGRVHREIRGFVPANSGEEPPLRSVTILDPVAGTRTVCEESTMQCAVSGYQARVALASDAGGPGKVTNESLGTQTMDGLTATGSRVTRATQTGGQLILSHTEAWYSPDLQMDLSVVRTNPQLGQVTLTVENLRRTAPDKSWFAAPAGFTVRGASTQ